MTQPARPPLPDDSSVEPKPAVPWVLTVTIHTGLLVLAVVVGWATIGRDAGGAASASIAGHAAPIAVEVEVEDDSLRQDDQPMAAPTAIVEKQTQPEPALVAEWAAPEPMASLEIPAEVEASSGTPIIKMPTKEEPWPVEMTREPVADPYADHGKLYGVPSATRVVYLVDASGSLIDTLPFVQLELQQSLRALQPQQSFAVMFFSGNRVLEAPPVGMTRATTDAVTISTQWIDPGSGKVIASGRPSPSAAIRRALAYQPDAIVLLSDGLTGKGEAALASRAELISLIKTANTHGTVFHTVQIRQPDPLASPTRRGTLEQIAQLTGGEHRYVSDDNLTRE